MTDNSGEIIVEVIKSIEAIGINSTVKALRNARKHALDSEDYRVNFVLRMVCDHYTQTISYMINSHSKSIKRIHAIKFSIYYLHEKFMFSLGDLQNILKRDKALLSRYNKEIQLLFKTNKSIKSTKDKFDLIINDFFEKNNIRK
jgi:hypothetical protein